jgi:intracellular sulfur oxidation DsrE/DsrF family protein
MKNGLFILVSLLFAFQVYSQTDKHKQDSIAAAQRDSLRMAKFAAMAFYPKFNAGTMSGVLPVKNVDEMPDTNRDYKLLFEFTLPSSDTTHKSMNDGYTQMCRILNLHVASRIPWNRIHTVILIHGPSLFSVINNDTYKAKYKTDNPNIKIVEELQNAGVKFIVCGQYMTFVEIKKEQLLPGIKLSLTAKTVLSNYQEQGYVLYPVNEER